MAFAFATHASSTLLTVTCVMHAL